MTNEINMYKGKAIIEWLNELPEELKNKALEYNKPHASGGEIVEKFETAIRRAFIWEDTAEGWEFWNEIAKSKQNEK